LAKGRPPGLKKYEEGGWDGSRDSKQKRNGIKETEGIWAETLILPWQVPVSLCTLLGKTTTRKGGRLTVAGQGENQGARGRTAVYKTLSC